MITALVLFAIQGALGAFDTLYYHEYRARLPGGVPGTAPELVLHAVRDLIYAFLFAALPFLRFDGALVLVVGALLLAEIGITLRDFVVEDTVRKPLGGVYPGERVTHAVMGILYGGALAFLVPTLTEGWARPTAITAWNAPIGLRIVLPLMAVGVFLSGLRDLAAVYGPDWARYPWGSANPSRDT
ncbi:MAG: hypothetical protein U0414_18390 [Polyangiaceae bacterium]